VAASCSVHALRVVGPVHGPSGYDRHTREFVRGFLRHGVAVQLTPLEGWSQPLPDARDVSLDALSGPVDADAVLHFTMPPHASPEPGARNVNYTMFEADGIPGAWAELAGDHDLVVVPTAAARDAWLAGGVPADSVRVSPLGVDAETFTRKADPLPLRTPDGRPLARLRTRFLNVAELRPRKNHVGLLRAWIRATRADDDAALVLKTDPRSIAELAHDVAAMQRRIGRTLEAAAPVVMLPAVLTEDQLVSLYRSATHYVSLSHGEGWDQPMMEAAVGGLRLIAPRHTAYLEYLTDDDAQLVPAELVPASVDGQIGREDAALFDALSWWAVDDDAAVAAIRAAIEGRDRPRTPPGPRIAADYGWDRAAGDLLDTIASVA
jgi:glycosyltransferase involved in cell wall biosynthesis